MRGRGRPRGSRRSSKQTAPYVNSDNGDVKIRGTIHQVLHNYKEMAGAEEDRTEKEHLLQHADHYQREVNKYNAKIAEQRTLREEGGNMHSDHA